MKVALVSWISPEMVKRNPNYTFLFGDNWRRVGLGGQARACRGQPNAIGIRTKKAPAWTADSFLTDDEYELNCRLIAEDFERVRAAGRPVVVPRDGLGTGRAELVQRAPRTFAFLQEQLKKLGQEK